MGNGGGTQVDGELVNSRFLLALRLRIDANEVGGTPGRTAWHGQRPCMRAGWRGRVRARCVALVRCGLGLGSVHEGKARRGPHGGPRSTTKLSRLPYAGRMRGRHVAGAAAARAQRAGRGNGVGCSPFIPLKRLRKSKTRKSDN
jgi:hypothetical protein